MVNEYDLIRQILLGKKEMFEQIVLKYQNLVYTVCLNIVRDAHEAENMAQETFLAAYISLKSFSGASFKSWLCKIAVNKSIDFKRKGSRARLVELDHTLHEALSYNGDSVLDGLLIKERKEKMDEILSGLGVKYREVIKALYYEGLSVKQIAKRLNLPQKTVETRLYRARQAIKERWANDGGL